MSQLRTIGRSSTTVKRDPDGTLRVTYHATDVVTVYSNGRIILNHGGWMTATTKTRMNQASNQFNLGYHVWQEDYHWYVDGHTLDFDYTPLLIRNGRDY